MIDILLQFLKGSAIVIPGFLVLGVIFCFSEYVAQEHEQKVFNTIAVLFCVLLCVWVGGLV